MNSEGRLASNGDLGEVSSGAAKEDECIVHDFDSQMQVDDDGEVE